MPGAAAGGNGGCETGIIRAIVGGSLTRDSELRMTAGGVPVLGFGTAVNDRRKNQSTGEREDCANFVDCTMLGTRAESFSRRLAKGAEATVEEKLRWSQWERGGRKRRKTEVVVDELEFMSGRGVIHIATRTFRSDGPGPAEPGRANTACFA